LYGAVPVPTDCAGIVAMIAEGRRAPRDAQPFAGDALNFH
jgi:hypothetical protein